MSNRSKERRWYSHTGQDSVQRGATKQIQLPNFDHFVQGLEPSQLANFRQIQCGPAVTSLPVPRTSPPTVSLASDWRVNKSAPTFRQDSGEHQQNLATDDREKTAVEYCCGPRIARSETSCSQSLYVQPDAVETKVSETKEQPWHLDRGIYQQQQQQQQHQGSDTKASEGIDSTCLHSNNGNRAVMCRDRGMTRAGNPRQRSGQACNACRSRKSRCNFRVDLRKCTDCHKHNWVCRFAASFRQGRERSAMRAHKAPTTTATNTSFVSGDEKSPLKPHTTAKASHTTDTLQYISPIRDDIDQGVLLLTESTNQVSAMATSPQRQRLTHQLPDTVLRASSVISPRSSVLANVERWKFSLSTDPAEIDTALTQNYLKAFMRFVNTTASEIFPPDRFMYWAIGCRDKSRLDRMMLYAMMAWGTLHDDGESRAADRATFRDIIYGALNEFEAQHSLQMTHTLFFTASIEFSDGRHSRAFSLLARCIDLTRALQLHVEVPLQDVIAVYGFSPSMTAECRRRTYWAISTNEALAQLSRGNPQVSYSPTTLLRLPCIMKMYEEDCIPPLPVFKQDTTVSEIVVPKDRAPYSGMIWLSQITAICSEIHLESWRSQNCYRLSGRHTDDSCIRAKLRQNLDAWAERYTQSLRPVAGGPDCGSGRIAHRIDNLTTRRSRSRGLEFLFHFAHMELNRRCYHDDLDEDTLTSYARNATIHAVETLRLAQQVLSRKVSHTQEHIYATRGPFIGRGLCVAVDIITAVGRTVDILEPKSPIMELIYSALELLDFRRQWWASSRQQYLQIEARVQSVFRSAQAAAGQSKQFFYCSNPLVAGSSIDFDLVYGTDRSRYIGAAYNTSRAIDGGDIFRIDTESCESPCQIAASRTMS